MGCSDGSVWHTHHGVELSLSASIFPVGQSTHSVLGGSWVSVPLGQASQEVCPRNCVMVPGGHSSQEVVAFWSRSALPDSQSTHSKNGAELLCPASQRSHSPIAPVIHNMCGRCQRCGDCWKMSTRYFCQVCDHTCSRNSPRQTVYAPADDQPFHR